MLKKSVIVSIIASSYLYGASMEGIGGSHARGISSDGSVVVGENGNEAYRWTKDGGMQGLGDLPLGNYKSAALAVNNDGSVIVGYGSTDKGYGNVREAVRWKNGVMQGLGQLVSGMESIATGVSSDGSVVVGRADSLKGTEAFRWENGVMQTLGDLTGGIYHNVAQGVSGDGSVVVGYGSSKNGIEAFHWKNNVMQGLGDLPLGDFQSVASAVNNDGSVVVGYGSTDKGSGNVREAVRWENGVIQGLGDLDGGNFDSHSFGVNGDGSVVVGRGHSTNGYEAFRWTKDKGMQSLTEWLAEGGYTLTGWSNTSAKGVSADGNTIVGFGTSANGTEAFIAKSNAGMVGLTDFNRSLESINGLEKQTLANVSTILHGTHGHPANKRLIDDNRFMWVAGDIVKDDRHNKKDTAYIGEVGVRVNHNDTYSYNIAVGRIHGTSKLAHKSEIDNDGYYLALESDIKISKLQDVYSTTTLTYGQNNLEIKRGYDNAGVLTHSKGDTTQTLFAIKQRFQHEVAKSFWPYIEINHIRINTDGYTESGGGFPATFDKYKENITDWRLGVDANFDLTESDTLVTTLEAVHRMQKKGKGISAQIKGLGSFNPEGRKYDQNWMKATVGLEHVFDNKSRFSITFNGTTKGEDPTYWTGLTYSMPF